MMCFKKNNSAFSLVELAVVIAIIGAIIAGGLMTAVGKREIERVRKTNALMREIMKAIDDYADYHGHLPCPADPALRFGDNGFGLQSTANTEAQQESDTVTTCDTTPAGIFAAAGNVIIGGLPVYTLNLPPEYAIDAWNKRFTYAVDQDLTYYGRIYVDPTAGRGYGDRGDESDGIPAQISGNIIVHNASGADLTAGGEGAAVIIVSHGPNGLGAWGGRGVSTVGIAAGLEAENTNNDNVFIQSVLSATFDDIVVYAPKWQLNGTELKKQ